MSNSMKTVVFIISLIAYFIYLSISSAFINVAINTGNQAYAALVIFISSGIGILVMLYAQAAVKYWYTGRPLKNAAIHVKLSLGKFRLMDRLLVYFLPALSIIIPVMQARSLAVITWPSILFLVIIIIIVEILFYVNSKTMKAYITSKGIIVRGIDLRLEIPIPSNYHNPSGYYPFNRIITFLDLNDKLLVEQSYDLGNIILKADADTLKQVKAVLIANGIKQKKF
ncbi:MAG: hypothetical protein K0Q65_213 [Clostridia bacterium]|nr:hypothetical protein [Clostridia bacterium]